MTTKTKEPQQKKNKDFGLPQVEFKPIPGGGRTWYKITAIIVSLVLIIGASVVYWFFSHSPTVDPFKEIPPMPEVHKSTVLESDTDFIDDNASAKHQAIEQEAQTPKPAKELKTLEGREDKKDFSTSHTTQPQKGTITNIITTGGYYYIVLGSFIDEDLASDYAHQLAQKGVEVTLIAPPPRQYFFRVAIKQGDVFRDAYEKAKALKAVYGPDIWVMKY